MVFAPVGAALPPGLLVGDLIRAFGRAGVKRVPRKFARRVGVNVKDEIAKGFKLANIVFAALDCASGRESEHRLKAGVGGDTNGGRGIVGGGNDCQGVTSHFRRSPVGGFVAPVETLSHLFSRPSSDYRK
jgi:hypothetical protein